MLSVTRERVRWTRTHALRDETFDFPAATWRRPAAAKRPATRVKRRR
jgi:hypothetical protein